MQRIQKPDPARCRCKIITNRKITAVNTSPNGSSLALQLSPAPDTGDDEVEELVCQHVFVATGYTRNAYQKILKGTRTLLPESHHRDVFPMGIHYGVMFDMEKGKRGAGMWLQGYNEVTHGVSVINFYQPLLLYGFRDLSYIG